MHTTLKHKLHASSISLLLTVLPATHCMIFNLVSKSGRSVMVCSSIALTNSWYILGGLNNDEEEVGRSEGGDSTPDEPSEPRSGHGNFCTITLGTCTSAMLPVSTYPLSVNLASRSFIIRIAIVNVWKQTICGHYSDTSSSPSFRCLWLCVCPFSIILGENVDRRIGGGGRRSRNDFLMIGAGRTVVLREVEFPKMRILSNKREKNHFQANPSQGPFRFPILTLNMFTSCYLLTHCLVSTQTLIGRRWE